MINNYCIVAKDLYTGYNNTEILSGIDVEIPEGLVTTIIGPNGCGKTTLLKALSALLPSRGEITLANENLTSYSRKKLSTILGVLPQSPNAPEGILVADLVSRGRYPHQTWFSHWSKHDEEDVFNALETTKMTEFANRRLDSLSGGQRQRAWIAMILAQQTGIMMLDEPTTFLDLSHSIEVLRTVRMLKTEHKRTIIMVLHDLNLAIDFSDHLIVMKEGKIVKAGAPENIITEELLKQVFGLDADVMPSPKSNKPVILPHI